MVANPSELATLIGEASKRLSPNLRAWVEANDSQKIEQALLDGLASKSLPARDLNTLYFIDSAAIRPALIMALKGLGLEPPYFRSIRRIFKAAELRRDGQVFGLLAHRFEKYKCKYRVPDYMWRGQKKETLGENPLHAFSSQTRDYFRNRVWASLRRMGELEDSDFVPMATGTLLAFTDEDAKPIRTESYYNWNTRDFRHVYWDTYGAYWAFNQLLYRHSPRFQATKKNFRVADDYETGSKPLKQNEAAFPELWKKEPRGLVHLLLESRCKPVHQFAARALRECKEFCKQLPLEVVKQLLQAKYDTTVDLGFRLAKAHYDASNPDAELVLILVNCSVSAARRQAREWIKANRSRFFEDVDFATSLFTSSRKDTRSFAMDSISFLPTDKTANQVLLGKLVAFLAGAKTTESEVAEDVGQTLLRSCFEGAISNLGEDVLCDLLKSEVNEVQMFAGSAIAQHRVLSKSPTETVLRAMLDATHPPVRALGIKLVSDLPRRVLVENYEVLAGLSCHALEDIRHEVRPLVKRLIESDSTFAKKLAATLIDRLLTPGAPDGVPSHTSRIVREELAQYLDHISAETVWKLLQARSAPAQEVGGFLISTNVKSDSLSVSEIVKLAGHEILTVRQAAWEMYSDNISRMRNALATAIRILDSKWEDSRQFGFSFLRDKIAEDELTPEVLIGICDSVRPDVQQFGREMITRRFHEKDGPEYLLKLSEHPTAELQLFASNFLVEYGSDQPDRIGELEPFFVSILSRVNKSRVAKDRVLKFLKNESTKDPKSAEIVGRILDRISATCAIGDRAQTIEGMLELHEAHPEVELPIAVKPLEVR